MKTPRTVLMESEIIQITWIWITALIIAPSTSQDIPRIKNLDCLNDFDTKMVCFWEVVNGNTNCSLDFQLSYTDFRKRSECEDLYNEYNEKVRVSNKCICRITVDAFIAEEWYFIEVESKGQSVGKADIYILSSVKPKPPSDLRVDLTEPENGVVHWKSNYEANFISTMLSFHIQFISKQDGAMALEHDFSQLEPRYMFSKRQLNRNQEYKVRVRTKHKSKNQTKEIWSEWSPEVEFRNDYELTIMDWIWFIIVGSSVVILLLTVSCYFCMIRTKEKWWNNIPDPARSKLAESGLIHENYLKPAGKPSTSKSCGYCLTQLVKAHKKSKHEQLTNEHPIKDSGNPLGSNMKKIIFEPEKVDIERCIHLYPREEDNLYEDLPEEKEEGFHLMDTDLSVGRMFCDILCDSSMMVEGLERLNVDNTFGSTGSSILRDHSQKTERHLPLSMVSQESGYQSYDSDDSPGDLKSDGPNPLYFEHPILSEGDFSPYAPVSSIIESGSNIGKEDAFVNSGYNSFANALAEVSSGIMEGDNISVFSLEKMFCKPNYHHSLQKLKSILYYNTKCFPAHFEEDPRPTITPTSDYSSKTCPTSVSEEPGYQSFNQAVQQGDASRSTTCLTFDFGYKPFNSLTRISINSLDNISGFSELGSPCPYKDLAEDNEHLPQTEVVDGTDLWNDNQSCGFDFSEFDIFDRKYPSDSEILGDEHKCLSNQASDIHHGIDRTLKRLDKPLALTFDISDHLRNFANMQGPKMSLGSEFVGLPRNLISFSCSLEESTIIHDDLLDKNGLLTNRDFPMKFENMSYFFPLQQLKSESYPKTDGHLLVQQNNTDKEGNSYMKITLW